MQEKNIDLQKVTIRELTTPSEKLLWNKLVKEQHYLKNSTMVGEQIRYVAECEGKWLACLGFSAATFRSSLRSKWIGWTPMQEKQRLHLVVQNARFLILKDISIPNLASRCLSIVSKRISEDWQSTYGHIIYLLETFVDIERPGTCYVACGWEKLGLTKGFRREAEGYKRHGIKKKYFVYPVKKNAREKLRSDQIADDKPLKPLKLKDLPLDENESKSSIHDILNKYFPKKEKKLNTSAYHTNVSISLVLAGFICGIKDSENVAAWAKELGNEHKRMLGCPYKIRKGISGYQTPSANTIRYALQDIETKVLEKAMIEWVNLCGVNSENTVLALDGKVLRGAKTEFERAPNHVTLYDVKSGMVVDQELVSNKTSEVTVARDIFKRNNLAGTLVTADAAHTNQETANLILKKKVIISSPLKKINLTFSRP